MYYILDGKKIRELMEQQNMNVSKLSELSGVSQSCIRNILNEKAMSTRINTAMHLVGALNQDFLIFKFWKVCDFENYKGIANAKYSCKKIGFSKYIASIRKENLQEKQKRIANMISIKEEKKIRESADTFNQYVGCEDILLIRASVPSFYMCYYVQELKQHEMIVEAKPDFFNSLYCIDIYIKIKKD